MGRHGDCLCGPLKKTSITGAFAGSVSRTTGKNILIDRAIQLTGSEPSKNYKHPIRRVVVYDTGMKEEAGLLTDNAWWKAGTVAALYKARWNTGIFFRTIKQLLRPLKYQARYKWHTSNLVTFLRLNLFSKTDLWSRLNHLFDTHPTFPTACTEDAVLKTRRARL